MRYFKPQTETSGYSERLAVKNNGHIVFVSVNEIDLITSEGNYVKILTKKQSYLFRQTMNAMEKRLDPNCFLRVRRSTIVRIKLIKELHPLFNGEFEVVLVEWSNKTRQESLL